MERSFSVWKSHLPARVAAIQLDERIQVDQNDSEPGDQHGCRRSRAAILQEWGSPQATIANPQITISTQWPGENGSQALQLCLRDPGFCDVHRRAGQKTHQAHAGNFPP